MIVALEGLMRVGKTSTISKINQIIPESIVIPEVLSKDMVSKHNCRKKIDNEDEFFIANDWTKSKLAQMYPQSKLILMDRYFLSTVAYRLCRDESLDMKKVLSIFSGVTLPDYWVLIEEDPLISWERAFEQKNGNILGEWKNKEFVKKMSKMYRRLFSKIPNLFPNTKVSIIQSRELYCNREVLLDELKWRKQSCEED